MVKKHILFETRFVPSIIVGLLAFITGLCGVSMLSLSFLVKYSSLKEDLGDGLNDIDSLGSMNNLNELYEGMYLFLMVLSSATIFLSFYTCCLVSMKNNSSR